MIEKYYNGAIEQILGGVGETPENSIMVHYGNELSVEALESVKRAKERDDLFFACHEFEYGQIAGAYEPYLDIICTMFRRYRTGSFAAFLEACEVYTLHRPLLLSYFETGRCGRNEPVLLDEVEYEQQRMTEAVLNMLLTLAEDCPVVILLNHFQLASQSAMRLTGQILAASCGKKIGLILGVNETQSIPEFLLPVWENIYEKMDDGGRVYHIGSSGQKKDEVREREYKEIRESVKLNNLIHLLDYEQAFYIFSRMERRIKFDNFVVDTATKYHLMLGFAKVAMLTRELPKALELCEELQALPIPGREAECRFELEYLTAIIFMYQGKLPDALDHAAAAGETARGLKDAYKEFLIELLETQIQMSGWYNIFFCAQDIQVAAGLLEKLQNYHFENHLAHVYVYAYDNKPEIVAKAYDSEESLVYFSKGIAIAKQIGNEQLISTAYRKNIMLASTNGMYEISLLYSVRTYEALREKESVEGGRIYSGIAYNLCAIGQNEKAKQYYNRAIRLFYRLKRPEDIAEVQYNMSLNCIMLGQYAKAESYLMQCMKAIEKLHLNSLRVCNLSKLYGLLALVAVLQGNRFNCERYLNNCRQFLNYVLEKEKMENGTGLGTVHDYAKVDDDLFLYTFAKARLAVLEEDMQAAFALYAKAEKYFQGAQGNQFFNYVLYRTSRIECYRAMGREDLCGAEQTLLDTYAKTHGNRYQGLLGKQGGKLLDALNEFSGQFKGQDGEAEISSEELDELINNESILLAYKSKKRQLEFISTWQKLIDVTGMTAEKMTESVMRTFLNHFNIDCALYVRYIERKAQILYNNTNVTMNEEVLGQIARTLKQNPSGFAISKISSNYAEYQEITAIFGEDEVCSMVAVPFFNNAQIESFLIVYVLMKENWHSSVNRYMLDEDDLNLYQLLFREVRYSLNRLDAYDKIYEMNTKLYLSAVTDQLTGIYNREGFYRKLAALLKEIAQGKRRASFGLMFIDLDNFKHYNDTFGHDIGDFILKQMADIFSAVSAGKGFVCRYGGDEFIIVLDTAEEKTLRELAEQIYARIAAADGFAQEIGRRLHTQVKIEEAHRISCSIGIAARTEVSSEEEINDMIKHADELLYSIKTSGKGTYRI